MADKVIDVPKVLEAIWPLPKVKGFLNRCRGEVDLLGDDQIEKRWQQVWVASGSTHISSLESVVGASKNEPGDWLEIPEYVGASYPPTEEEKVTFARNWLNKLTDVKKIVIEAVWP
jgi:hypothetical protein